MACVTGSCRRIWCCTLLAAWRPYEKKWGMIPLAPYEFDWHVQALGIDRPYVARKSIKMAIFTGVDLLPADTAHSVIPASPPCFAGPQPASTDDIDLDALAANIC